MRLGVQRHVLEPDLERRQRQVPLQLLHHEHRELQPVTRPEIDLASVQQPVHQLREIIRRRQRDQVHHLIDAVRIVQRPQMLHGEIRGRTADVRRKRFRMTREDTAQRFAAADVAVTRKGEPVTGPVVMKEEGQPPAPDASQEPSA